jgi:hypothetical protein
MKKQGVTIIILKNRAEKCDNKEYEIKDIYRLYTYILTLKND